MISQSWLLEVCSCGHLDEKHGPGFYRVCEVDDCGCGDCVCLGCCPDD